LLVLGAAFSVQFGAALAVTIFDDLGPAGASALRVGLAAVILMLAWRPRVRGLAREDAWLVIGLGIALGVMNLAFYEALERVPLGIAVTIEFAGPLGVAVALSRRRSDVAWVVLAAAGIVLLADPGGGKVSATGLALVLIAAAMWAIYILLAARLGARFSGGGGLALAMVIAALVPLGPGIAEAGGDLFAPELLAIGAAVAVLSSVIPYSLEVEALRRMPREVFGVLMSLEPALAALGGFVVLDQSLSARDLVAIGLVTVASIGATRSMPAFDG
jgi:inner membrane transporter RhtA